jgi:1-acyl-sn-glycerol-3-phosphate acyltransferase
MKSKFYIVVRFCLLGIVRFLFWVSFKGRDNEPKLSDGTYLVCANHISMLDPLFICAAMRQQQPRFMAKAELFKIPVFSSLLLKLGAFPVERNGADAGVLKKSIRMLGEGYSVGLFPQGTRRKGVDPKTTPVRGGAGLIASRSKAPVLPVYIKTKKNKLTLFGPVKVIVGEPISYEEYTDGGQRDSATEISNYIFSKICELDKETQQEKK